MEELTLGSIVFRGAAVVLLITANGFFVAAEFALVASRRTRIDAMVRGGDRKAKRVQLALQDLYKQLSAAQLGITLASILLGYVAEDTVAVLLHGWVAGLPPLFAFLGRGAVITVVAVSIISFLHVVVGEQAPKAWAITHPEPTSRWVAAPLMFFAWITKPATNFLNWSANQILRLMGISSTHIEAIHSPEEIVMLLKQSQKSGRIDLEDVRMIEGVFEFTEKLARDVMTPRTDVIALRASLTLAEAAERIADAGRSRYPVYRESLDNVVGTVHVKQVLQGVRQHPDQPISAVMREPLFVPGTREVEDVLADMKHLKIQIAIVLDEYGGTAGIVTMEDLLEEIVGEIYDEFDRAAEAPVAADDGVTVPGDMEIDELNRRYGLKLSTADYTTIGGYIFGRLGRLPRKGDRITEQGTAFEVLEIYGKRVGKLKVVMSKPTKRGVEQKPVP